MEITNYKYLSNNGKWHRIVVRDGKFYLKCNHAVGSKTLEDLKQHSLLHNVITCKNCLRWK